MKVRDALAGGIELPHPSRLLAVAQQVADAAGPIPAGTYPLDRDDTDPDTLQTELSDALGRPVHLSVREPGALPGCVRIMCANSGAEIRDADPATVASVVAAHRPPPGPEQAALEAIDAATDDAGRIDAFRDYLTAMAAERAATRDAARRVPPPLLADNPVINPPAE